MNYDEFCDFFGPGKNSVLLERRKNEIVIAHDKNIYLSTLDTPVKIEADFLDFEISSLCLSSNLDFLAVYGIGGQLVIVVLPIRITEDCQCK